MALPILDTATYELTLPSSEVQVKYRPFLVKEEKILLLALESNDGKEIKKALKEIVHACTFGTINVNAVPTFDLEFVFLQIRSKSVGEVANIRLLCPDDKTTYANIELDSLCNGVDFNTRISRAKFEVLCDSLFKKCLAPVERVLRDSKISKSDVNEVVLVGGSTRIPKIQSILSKK